MKMKQWIKFGAWLLVLAAMLCSIGMAQEMPSVADVYERTENDRVYQLSMIDTDSHLVEDACIKDGYILLVLRSADEPDFEEDTDAAADVDADDYRWYIPTSDQVVLLPIQRPEAAVTLELDELEGGYTLLEGGTVLEVKWDGSYVLYNARLEEVYREKADCGTFLGASDQGDVWFMTEDTAFVLYRDGKKMLTVQAEAMTPGNYAGTQDGKAYFVMYNDEYDEVCVAVDMQEGTCRMWPTLTEVDTVVNGKIHYASEDEWYFADLADPFTVMAFTKPYSDERLWKMDDHYLIGETIGYDDVNRNIRLDYSVYDLRNGGLCEKRSSSELSANQITMLGYDQGLILYATYDAARNANDLFLWDIGMQEAQQPARNYQTLDYHVDQDRIDKMIEEIYQQYGVTVYYDQEHLQAYSSNYDLEASDDMDLIGYTLCRLKACMAEYPVGIFEEMKGENHSKIVYCLCGNHVRRDEDGIERVLGTVTSVDDALRMSLDVHAWTSLRRTFLHENTHVMEHRVEEEMPKITRRNYVEYWFKALNSPKYPSMQRYIWEQNEKNLQGVYNGGPEDAWYIDWYSKCAACEDEARVMEHGIYSASARYFMSPHIDKKSRFLNAMIREAFPCVKNAQEPVFWEQRTGIVDLYSEFPDFIVR